MSSSAAIRRAVGLMMLLMVRVRVLVLLHNACESVEINWETRELQLELVICLLTQVYMAKDEWRDRSIYARPACLGASHTADSEWGSERKSERERTVTFCSLRLRILDTDSHFYELFSSLLVFLFFCVCWKTIKIIKRNRDWFFGIRWRKCQNKQHQFRK